MKRIVPVLLLMALLVTGARAETETVSIFCVPGDIVNIREKPNAHSDVCGRYECGYTFKTDGQTRKDSQGRVWVHMVDAALEVAEAWVCGSYVQDSEVTIATVTAKVDASGRVASRACPDGKRRKWVKPGTEVTVFAWTDEWAVTEKGYIKMEYLLFDGSEG